jgi:DNA modification methylase
MTGTTYTLAPEACLFHADCREALRALPDNSIDSGVMDPPYALVSIVKRFGSANAAPAKGNEAYMRASAGFMGKTWDTGETAMSVEFWAEVLRVLKPGAHLVAFGASRGYHRMACAIEDAGFEIRDSLMWVYGTGFPKSQNVARFIDDQQFYAWLDVDPARRSAYTAEMKSLAALPDKVARSTAESQVEARWRELAGFPLRFGDPKSAAHAGWIERGQMRGEENEEGWQRPWMDNPEAVANAARRYLPASAQAEEFDGWGTALKPAFEPIVLARKPLSEKTVAANVLRWRTGALNIDACRVDAPDAPEMARMSEGAGSRYVGVLNGGQTSGAEARTTSASSAGRWPANVVHDGSPEVVEAFPETQSGVKAGGKYSRETGVHEGGQRTDGTACYGDSGSAARFFYSAKASKADRAGSKHPTVKPIALKRYLVRLVTPRGGVVLDPFAGSGTTGAAAVAEGCKVILCEREAEYVEDIRRRFGHVTSPPIAPESVDENILSDCAI